MPRSRIRSLELILCTLIALGREVRAGEHPNPKSPWRPVGSLQDVRESSGIVLLPDGRVLVAGGHAQTRRNTDGSKWRLIGTAELYDPKTETWSPTGSLVETRQGVGALTLLPNGKVLLAGEHDTRTGAELYDPASGKWSPTGSLATGRGVHSTTALLDGRVLVAGGVDYSLPETPIFASAEIYDSRTEKWNPAGSMASRRFKHASARLADGRILVAGGTATEPSKDPPLAGAEIYDPISGGWSQTGSLSQAREQSIAAVLNDGRVLVAGGAVGNFGSYRSLASAEIYNPETGTWSSTGAMAQDRVQFAMVRLPDGRVLAIGGVSRPSGTALASAEIYDPATGSWTPAGTMETRRWNHRALPLPSGDVLVVGGFNRLIELNTAEIFTPP